MVSNLLIKTFDVVSYEGGFFLVRFRDSGGAIRVRARRLFPTKEEAEDFIRKQGHGKKGPV